MSPSRDGRSRDPRRPDSSGRPGRGPSGRNERRAAGNGPRAGGQARRPPGGGPPPRRPAPRGGSGPGPPSPLRQRFRRGSSGRRIKIAVTLMAVVMSLFAARLVQIQGLDAATYASQASDSRLNTIDVPTARGEITDSSGNAFATSVEVRTVFVDPVDIRDDQRDMITEELSNRFGLDRHEVSAKVDAEPSRYEVVKRDVSPDDWRELEKLKLQGVGAEVDYKRVYPENTGAADLVGFTGAEDKGLEGLEGVMDSELAGEPGKRQVEVGASGARIPTAGGLAKEPVPGKDVRLTLDQDLQWKAERALAKRAKELDADGGSVIAMRPNGKILAMADYPTYSPDHIDESTAAERSNGAVADAFEPGSTNKVITAAGALEEGKTSPEKVYTVPDSLRRYDKTFRDSHTHPTEQLTLNGIIAKSSNVGTIQVGEQLGARNLYDYLGKFGFGRPTGLDLPGENAGLLTDPDDWSGTQLPVVSFGQGLSVNAVQMASVYATIANDGVRVEPRLVEGTRDTDTSGGDTGKFTPAGTPKKERVTSKKTSDELKLMLEAVTSDEGTAQKARIPGYRVAGKTGTANQVDSDTGSYKGGGYSSTFVGFAPADDPEVIVQAVLHNPKKKYYGGEASAPVFTDVMSFGLKTEKVRPTGGKAPNIRLYEDK